MAVYDGLFSSESVARGHPDKMCDRISDAILDAFLTLDPDARVACETMAADAKVIVAGEFRTAKREHFEQVREQAPEIVRRAIREIGYGQAEYDIDPGRCEIEIRFNHQSPEIGAGVDHGTSLGAGDQGLMFGYATDENDALMPLAWSLANDLVHRASELVATPGPLRPDGKAQVTVRYLEGHPVGLETVVLSWQHDASSDLKDVREYLRSEVIEKTLPKKLLSDHFNLLVNPAGRFTIGGPKGDTGLTGRKIIVDTYGGACAHGGGAFSGKDPSKVDRSAAYAARHVALNIVSAGLAKRCTVQLAYAIGVSEPVSVNVETHGTGAVSSGHLERAVRDIWDLTPSGIIEAYRLKRPIYTSTSAFGHFGRWRDKSQHLWENPDKTDELRLALKAFA